MPRREGLPHIVVPTTRTEARRYTYPKRFSPPKPPIPHREPRVHGAMLNVHLAEIAVQQVAVNRARERVGVPPERGMVLEFASEPEFPLAIDSLDRKRVGMEVLSVREQGATMLAAVFVPDGKLSALEALVTKYETSERGTAPGEGWLAPIAAIRRAAVRTLWQDEGELPPPTLPISWELWLRDTPVALDDVRVLAHAVGIELGSDVVRFVDRIVVLGRGTLDQLAASVELLDCVAELRRARDLTAFFRGLSPADEGDWVRDLAGRTQPVGPDAPVVCLLDTGVNRGHPLLAPLLADADLHTVEDDWGRTDHTGHGTLMAGLAGWGDLGLALASTGPVAPVHGLESVVLVPPKGAGATEPKLWASVTLRAVSLPELAAPARDRVFCMTVTTDDGRDRGRPSSWSAEVDALCEGGRDGLPRLFVVSAGNVPQGAWRGYLDANDTYAIEDPAQAWNAVTVGAYTDRAHFDEGALPGHRLIGTPGSLSPSSATSVGWPANWPNKPDVVFEGGNATLSPPPDPLPDTPDALRLLSTHWRPPERLLDTTGDTSGAAALGARFATRLTAALSSRGEVWPETVRALMVHSARWTSEMRRGLSTSRQDRDLLLRRYGWGVPDLERAVNSATNAVTLVAQREIQPFENTNKSPRASVPEVKTKDWHLFTLPWPARVLQDLGNTPVTLRVTLSYYVEPNPARRGETYKRRYASAGLRFAMKNPLESLAEFQARMSRNDQDANGGPPAFSEPGWLLGDCRNRGSLHSDVWVGPAVELAERGYVAVTPVVGWWRERVTAGRYDERMRYALVVSIETDAADVDIYTPVAVAVAAEVAIEP